MGVLDLKLDLHNLNAVSNDAPVHTFADISSASNQDSGADQHLVLAVGNDVPASDHGHTSANISSASNQELEADQQLAVGQSWDERSSDLPVCRHGAADNTSASNQEADQQLARSQPSHDGGVRTTDTSFASKQEMDLQPAVDQHSSEVLPRGRGLADTTSTFNQEAEGPNGGIPDRAGVAKPSPPSRSVPLSDTSGQYTYLIFILSTFIGFVAIFIQYKLEFERQSRNTGFIKPGWALHRECN